MHNRLRVRCLRAQLLPTAYRSKAQPTKPMRCSSGRMAHSMLALAMAGKPRKKAFAAKISTAFQARSSALTPITGKALRDNPFYDGNADSNRSKVFAYGLRNPFRFTFAPSGW